MSKTDGIGVWKWNDVPSNPTAFQVVINGDFVSNGIQFSQIDIRRGEVNYHLPEAITSAYFQGEWIEAYKTFQVLSISSGLDYIQSNAEYQSGGGQH